MSSVTEDIAQKCAAWREMELDWHPVRSLLGGTRAMRAASTVYLPRETGEEKRDYQNRLRRSFLYGGFKNAINELGSKPFQKPVTVADVPEPLDRLAKDVDRSGTSITKFAFDLLREKMAYGKAHILIDSPNVQGATKLDEKERDLRPYFALIPADRVIGWKSEIHDSKRVLTEVRILDSEYSIDGQYAERREDRIKRWWVTYDGDKVVEAGWEVYAKKDGVWGKTKEGKNPLNKIPLVVDYAEELDFMTARPPLMEIADIAIAHWQSASDHRNILRFVTCPILWRSGVSSEEVKEKIAIGAGAVFSSTVVGATMNYVEHSGAGVKSAADNLERLESQMRVLALQPLIEAGGNATATGASIDEARTNSILKRWVRGSELAIEKAFEIAAEWANVELPEDWKGVDIFDEFGLSVRAAEDIRQLIDLRGKKHITAKTELAELKRRGLFTDTFDVDAEISALEEDGPDLTELADIIVAARAANGSAASQASSKEPDPKPGPNGPSGPPNGPAQRAA